MEYAKSNILAEGRLCWAMCVHVCASNHQRYGLSVFSPADEREKNVAITVIENDTML